MGLIVYPPNKHKTDSPTIFFIGSAEKYCKINDQDIELINGNFCPVFDLELGENVFNFDLDGESFVLKVFKTEKEQKLPGHSFQIAPNSQDLTTSPYKVCIDPGHGGSQRGTCSPKGLAEKDLNLKFALLLKHEFEAADIEVVLTRDSDVDLELADRVKISKDNACNLFISIHHNAIPDHEMPLDHYGISAHYYYEHSKDLAEKLSAKIAKAASLFDRGAIRQNLHVLRENSETIAVLLELGFLIHPQESEMIISRDFQEKAVRSIVQFLNEFGV